MSAKYFQIQPISQKPFVEWKQTSKIVVMKSNIKIFAENLWMVKTKYSKSELHNRTNYVHRSRIQEPNVAERSI